MDWWDWYHREQSIYEMAEGGMTSLYVGDLEPTVTDSELFDVFRLKSYVSSVRVCKDFTTNTSLGYGYATFDDLRDAKIAIEMVNFTSIKGKEIRVMYYVHNPSLQKRSVGNIFITNLEKSINHKDLYETFRCFGSILKFKVATNASGQSKGFAFVQHETEESAQRAIKYLNGMLLNDEQLYVGPFLQRDSSNEKAIFTDIFVKNLSKSLTDEELNTVFQEFGPTTSCVIIRDGELLRGKSKGYGFVNFENPEDAEKAVESLNGKKFDEKEWFVTKSNKKYRRESQLVRGLKEAIKRSQSSNKLCIKNLSKCITDEILKELFSTYGTITSCKVMRDSSGVSKGSGFVVFSKPEEASKAMKEINGEMKKRQQIYVDTATITLANATLEQKRNILGDNLYSMVEQIEPESAAKITGMILEMDQTQVLHLLESFGALESKVAEAMEILRRTVKEQEQQKTVGLVESPVQHFVSDHMKKTVTESIKNSESSVIPKTFKTKLSSSARANKRQRARENKRQRARERSAVFLESKVTETVEVVRTVSQQPQHDGGESESPIDPKSYLSPFFISPKPSLLARVNKRLSTRERQDALVRNRFDSLKENDEDACTQMSISD